jgi:hypothetical protein
MRDVQGHAAIPRWAQDPLTFEVVNDIEEERKGLGTRSDRVGVGVEDAAQEHPPVPVKRNVGSPAERLLVTIGPGHAVLNAGCLANTGDETTLLQPRLEEGPLPK